ncbi:unnamed protein product [Cercopithifilaria johnstoni]|uniref:Uncharacterized protein n=1 Tax=Cercopithifilaria johnstoni TaxID=2874296 RepID=A0A8J2M3A4_9BILA|nr:unnamed protein product [Cercopithifilaria johnstoni]
MDMNIGIDSKPRTRRGRRRFGDRLITLGGDRNDDINDPIDSNITLNVRVKERENGARKGSSGSIFKDTPTTVIKSLFHKDSSYDLKNTVKRPLTGLFRRPSSHANSKLGVSKSENRTGTNISVSETPNYGNEHIISQSSETSCFEEVLHDVANAPSVTFNQISTMYQLGVMTAKNISLAKLDDIDLSLLSRFLCIEEEVNDEKISWTWDYLFASVSTEMRDEWAQDEGYDDYDHEDENLIK